MTKQSSNWKEYVKIWFDFYRLKTGQEYVFDGTQGRHLKQLIAKVKSKVSQKGIEPTDENVLNSFKGFLSHLNDQWILEHLEISIINSKFNVIYAKAVKSNPFSAASRIDDIVEARFNNSRAAG